MTRARILADYVSSGDELADKAPLANPDFTGSVDIGDASASYAVSTADDLTIRPASGANGGITISSPQSNIFFSDTTSGAGQYAGAIQYTHSNDLMRFYTGSASRMQMVGDDIILDTGDLVFGTAGKGIVLGATSNVDANTLDDYEEGTWTPIIAPNSWMGSSLEYGPQLGVYTKIGNQVIAQFRMTITALTVSGTDNVAMGGFPFTNQAAFIIGASNILIDNNTWTSSNSSGINNSIALNNTVTTIKGNDDTSNWSSNLADGAQYWSGTVIYRVD